MDIKNIRSELVDKYNGITEKLNKMVEDLQTSDVPEFNSMISYRKGIWHAIEIIDKECKKI
jgi:hypothetical protein